MLVHKALDLRFHDLVELFVVLGREVEIGFRVLQDAVDVVEVDGRVAPVLRVLEDGGKRCAGHVRKFGIDEQEKGFLALEDLVAFHAACRAEHLDAVVAHKRCNPSRNLLR